MQNACMTTQTKMNRIWFINYESDDSICILNFTIRRKCSADDNSLKIQWNFVPTVYRSAFPFVCVCVWINQLERLNHNTASGPNCWKYTIHVIQKSLPHRHPSSSTIYGLWVENSGASIFDEISIFVSLNSLLLWRPAKKEQNEKNSLQK